MALLHSTWLYITSELPTSWYATEWEIPKNEWDGGLQAWDMFMEIKYCGSSTMTNNQQKHSQNVMATIIIYLWMLCALYIYYNSYTPLHFLRLPLSLIFCFIVALGLALSIAKSQSAVACDVDYPVLIPSRTQNVWELAALCTPAQSGAQAVETMTITTQWLVNCSRQEAWHNSWRQGSIVCWNMI